MELFELGKDTLKTPAGNFVSAYDLERIICDVIRSRNKPGTEIFLSALKQCAASPKKNLNKLNEYAGQMRAANVLLMTFSYKKRAKPPKWLCPSVINSFSNPFKNIV